ncbi:MAG TPA: hypothetical protein VKT29_08025 [Terriglobales bacterium]|nr:hypothetical protein [Terriglobales bacterium]
MESLTCSGYGEHQLVVIGCRELTHCIYHGVFRGESILFDRIPKLLHAHRIPRLEVNRGHAFIEADRYGLDSRDFFDCHAHGVGANPSIHAENGQINMVQLSLPRQHD